MCESEDSDVIRLLVPVILFVMTEKLTCIFLVSFRHSLKGVVVHGVLGL